MPPLSCPCDEDLHALLHGELGDEPARLLQAHLASCPDCARRAAQMEADLWSQPVPSLPDILVGPADLVGSTSPDVRATGHPRAPASPAPEYIGPYALQEELGRGAMGVVYKAHDTRLNRTVALKVMLGGAFAGPEGLVRFQVEAEMAARVQHPGVVQVYEVGTWEGGPQGKQPYVVLEYVEGGTLADRLTGAPWPPREAARLVAVLAEAVQAAHAQGVIHRDLKPANVLLAPPHPPTPSPTQGGEGEQERRRAPPSAPQVGEGGWGGEGGVPKITDFGLARPAEQARRLTASGAIVGTPTYMSPEQACGESLAVGPASDVYSLGVILYELLTGTVPFQGDTHLEVLHQVVGTEPTPPSARVPRLPRDLEVICLKCLRKEPVRRYPSAKALADDLTRWLQGKPITARPVGRLERMWLWARRAPLVAGLTVCLVVVTASGAAVAGWQWREAVRQTHTALKKEQQAREARDLAEERFDTACDAIDFMLDRVGQEQLALIPQMEPVRRELLEEALRIYERFLRERGHDTALLARTARVAQRVSEILGRLGQDEQAEQASRNCLRLRQELAERFPDEPRYQQDLAGSWMNLGNHLLGRHQVEKADACYREAVALQKRVVDEHPGEPRYVEVLARMRYNQALSLRAAGQHERARESIQEALALLGGLPAGFAGRPEVRLLEARAHYALGNAERDRKQPDRARAEFTKAIAILEPLDREHPEVPAYRHTLATALHNRAQLLKGEEALAGLRRARDLDLGLLARFPSVPTYRHELAVHLVALASRLPAGSPEAEEGYRQARDHWLTLVHVFPAVPLYRVELGAALQGLGQQLRGRGQLREARDCFAGALAQQKAALPLPGVPAARSRAQLRLHLLALADVQFYLGDHAGVAEAAMELFREFGDRAEDSSQAVASLVDSVMLADLAPGTEAERRALRDRYADLASKSAQALIDRHKGPGSAPWYNWALVDLTRGDEEGYRKACTEAMARFTTSPNETAVHWAVRACCLGPDSGTEPAKVLTLLERERGKYPREYLTRVAAAGALFRAGRAAEAVAEAEEAARLHGKGGAALDRLWLALACRQLGQDDRARQALGEARAWVQKARGGTLQDPVFGSRLRGYQWLEMRLLLLEAEKATPREAPQ